MTRLLGEDRETVTPTRSYMFLVDAQTFREEFPEAGQVLSSGPYELEDPDRDPPVNKILLQTRRNEGADIPDEYSAEYRQDSQTRFKLVYKRALDSYLIDYGDDRGLRPVSPVEGEYHAQRFVDDWDHALANGYLLPWIKPVEEF
ncbi:MAG TPA: hypothetical protein VMR18_00215 [Candidatus Saccharimonadales bacterium]|nr:hypothetical protein [Candidatus Saccharimonadales bacterium]